MLKCGLVYDGNERCHGVMFCLKPSESINKTFIFETKTFIFETKSTVFKNKTFIYRFGQVVSGFM